MNMDGILISHMILEFRVKYEFHQFYYNYGVRLFVVSLHMLQSLYSKSRTRLQKEGYDLDLTYVTPNVIAMSFPATGVTSLFKNHIEVVERFLRQFHNNHFMVYNLTFQSYDRLDRFDRHYIQVSIPDHNSPPVYMGIRLVNSILQYLKEDNENVAVVHCQGGKGRTGTIVSCLLLALSNTTPDAAMRLFAFARSGDGSASVDSMSQRRFVETYDKYLKNPAVLCAPEQEQYLQHYFILSVQLSQVGFGVVLELFPITIELKLLTNGFVPDQHEPFSGDFTLILKRRTKQFRCQLHTEFIYYLVENEHKVEFVLRGDEFDGDLGDNQLLVRVQLAKVT